ncbi:acyl-CoA Delta(11) desaturase [Harpegnathos saltator]|uniref:Acyl-CoA Delta(11) desaturase n=1 Tax=Harpegnathos saltator TaxID=610380 RepID=E2C1U0_HARSA|nr:acyl-CoA Delta(11) desaturase [Harpegnathos saltator]XP_011149113.1 acyl-CoA Delta(11) desaturase [Harpegnathos saltator]XP_011149114.1 acyl-CoA Delta(11) desaturase [Harpegnathos saltator]EFN78052.1 Acyl-CoA Delta(11) desaturase [Harpegnathos saltator]
MTEINEQNGSVSNSDNEKTNQLSKNWLIILFYIYLHIFGIGGFYFLFTKAKWMTVLYFASLVIFSYIGLTVGAHRLYAHQTFTASTSLRFFLVTAHILAGVGPLYDWVLWHRVHHKYHNTDKDPYDHRKGFIYAHVLGNFLSVPSDQQTYLKNIDMRDVDSDRLVWLQKRFYWILFIVLGFLLPVRVPVMYWGESFVNSVLVIGVARLIITTHIAWLVNSALLVWGMKKGARYPINDNSVFFLMKSYWLNYHYILPWDWKSEEFGSYEKGFSTFMIKMMYEMGLIKNMKTATTEDLRETLEEMATSQIPINEAFNKLKKKSEENACRESLLYHP